MELLRHQCRMKNRAYGPFWFDIQEHIIYDAKSFPCIKGRAELFLALCIHEVKLHAFLPYRRKKDVVNYLFYRNKLSHLNIYSAHCKYKGETQGCGLCCIQLPMKFNSRDWNLLEGYLRQRFLPSSSKPFCLHLHLDTSTSASPEMELQCIICLNSLPCQNNEATVLHPDTTSVETLQPEGTLTFPSSPSISSIRGDVAHLQHCRHKFHDHCISLWIDVLPCLISRLLILFRLQIPVPRVVRHLIRSTFQTR